MAAECPHTKNFNKIDSLSMLQLEPPQHTRLRRLVNRAFVASQVDGLKSQIEQLANRLIDDFPQDSEVELLDKYASPIPVIVIARLLGAPEAMTGQLLDWSHQMVAMYQFGRTRSTETTADQAALELSLIHI